MNIRELNKEDIDKCVTLLIETYNRSPWNDKWSQDMGWRYLSEFISDHTFVGFGIFESDEIIGVIFGHRKTWWTGEEIFIDELFIKPDYQRKGYGKTLLEKIEIFSKERGIHGVTLLTNKHLPAKIFYERNEFAQIEDIIFMYKKV